MGSNLQWGTCTACPIAGRQGAMTRAIPLPLQQQLGDPQRRMARSQLPLIIHQLAWQRLLLLLLLHLHLLLPVQTQLQFLAHPQSQVQAPQLLRQLNCLPHHMLLQQPLELL